MTVPSLCAELDELHARREKAMLSPGCPPELVAVSDRVRELRAALRERVLECQAQMLAQSPLAGRRKVPDERAELLYFTSWALLKFLDK